MGSVIEIGESSYYRDLVALVDVAEVEDLRLRPPVAGNKYSADVMVRRPGRPPIGVQGRILDAMDDELVTVTQAARLLDRVNARLREGVSNGR